MNRESGPEPALAIEPRLDDRVLAILGGAPGEITFNGIRRALDAHPESLTRSLKRLSREGRVLRHPTGYRLGPHELAPRSGAGPLASYPEPARAL
ncbi:MAG: hypothetical protein L3J72_04970, partial [Thermoplasmata archaeon]|nr:hypothetical protein [Thermoplasmata archaeon]